MFLYELAITLDQRSPDLIEAAARLGLGELQPASNLDAQQVAVLRAQFGGAPVPPPPPPSSGPSAPAMWGPPTAPAAPATWGPPTGASAPSPGAHAGPQFAYPDSPIAEAGPGGGPGGGSTPPPPPGPVPPAWAAPPNAPSSGGIGTGQKVVIGAVVLLVLALFGFMAVNTGPDEKREQAIASKEKALEAELNATTAPPATTTAAPTTTAPPSQDQYEPVDVEKFCRGGIAISTFELRMVAAIADQDFDELTTLVRERRAGWNDDVATLAAGAAPILVNDIELYRGGYDVFFDAIETSSSIQEVYTKIDQMTLMKSVNAAQEFNTQVVYECQ